MSKKTKIAIALLFLSIVFLSALAYLIFNKTSLNKANYFVEENLSLITENLESKGVFDQPSKEESFFSGPRPVDADADDTINKLKEIIPELTEGQIIDFVREAAKNSIKICHTRKDDKLCAFSIAFLSRNYDFCGDIGHDHEEYEKIYGQESDWDMSPLECYNSILAKKAQVDIYDCYKDYIEEDNLLAQCLISVFPSSYEKIENCNFFSQENLKIVCEGVVNFRIGTMTGNKSLCGEIKETFLRDYCLRFF